MPKPPWAVSHEVQLKNLYCPSGLQPSIVGGVSTITRYVVLRAAYGCFSEIRQHAHAVDGVQIP